VSYDPHSGEDSFLQIAEKVKNKDAKVTSVTLNRDSVGLFTTGKTTITFEVEVWDT
jgi:D-arabinose 5-phosphate isomerase GutQ